MKLLLVQVCTAAVLFSACANNENESNKNAEKQNKEQFADSPVKKDAEFCMEAASGGLMEVELGNMAMSKAASDEVRMFGQSMVTDHSQANEELKALAQAKNIALPSVPDNRKQQMIDKLSSKSGKDFDKAYIDMMVDDHKEDIEAFKKEAENGNDGEIKSWAQGKVPVLQHHLQMAEAAQQNMRNK